MLFASLLPDADHRHAPMGRIIPLWLFFKHRKFTHTIYAMALFSLPFFYVSIRWGMMFLLGYYTHLALDSGTISGIRWFGERKRKKRAA
jgi:membrane-bound metal-dependent hydrolase YbcI (DUF457 family)